MPSSCKGQNPCSWSSGETLAASNPRRVGQVSRGLEGPLVDGMVPRGERESSLPGLHEMVWSLGGRNAPGRWGPGESRSLPGLDEIAIGVLGAARRLPQVVMQRPDGAAWFGAGGEASLQALRVMKRRYGSMAHEGSTPDMGQKQGVAQGAARPLAEGSGSEPRRWRVLHAHLARSGLAGRRDQVEGADPRNT